MCGWQKVLANSYGFAGVEIYVRTRKARKAGLTDHGIAPHVVVLY